MTYRDDLGRPDPPIAGDETLTLLGSLERQPRDLRMEVQRCFRSGR